MALRKIADGPAGTLVVYHYTAELDARLNEAAEGFTIYNETLAPGKGLYDNPSPIDHLPKPLYLAGFSEGCQGVRAQLLRKILPAGVICADGIHASKDVKTNEALWNKQIEPFRQLYIEAMADQTLFQVSVTKIATPKYMSTLETLPLYAYEFENEGAFKRTPMQGDTAQAHELCAPIGPGQVVIRIYPGTDAAAHVNQAKVVLPQMIRDFLNPGKVLLLDRADEPLGTPPKTPATPPKVPPTPPKTPPTPPAKPPKPGTAVVTVPPKTPTQHSDGGGGVLLGAFLVGAVLAVKARK